MNKTFLNVALWTPSLVGAFVLGTLCQNGDQQLRAGCTDQKPIQTLWAPMTIDWQSTVQPQNDKMGFVSQFKVETCEIDQEVCWDDQDGATRYQIEWDASLQRFVFCGRPIPTVNGAYEEFMNTFHPSSGNSSLDRFDSPLYRYPFH
jgi:hypothetical protein